VILDQDELSSPDRRRRRAGQRREVLDAFDRHAASFGELLGAQDNARMLAKWRMRAGDRVVVEAPRRR